MRAEHLVWVMALLGCSKHDDAPPQSGSARTSPPPIDAPAAPPPPTPLPDATVAAAIDAAVEAPADAAEPDPAAASKAAYPELLEMRKRFVFEIVEGTSLSHLVPTTGMPHVFGTVGLPQAVDGGTRIILTTRPEGGKIAPEYGQVSRVMMSVVFDDAGIRQMAAFGGSTSDRESIRGFTFPLPGAVPTKIDGHADFGPVTVTVSRRKLAFANAPHDVVLAETKIVEQASNSTTFETFAYAPGIGPALLCVAGEDPHGYLCLRYLSTEDRRCVAVATAACAGRDQATCDGIYTKLMQDPKSHESLMGYESERNCEDYLADPAKLEAALPGLGH